MSVEKKRRLSTKSSGEEKKTSAFEKAEALELVGWSKRGRTIHTMVIDNKRGLLYLLDHKKDRGLAIEQFAIVTPHEILSSLGVIPILSFFPPGILPLVAAYAGHWARRTWQRFVSLRQDLNENADHPTDWERAEVESSTGDLICSFTYALEFARMTSTGALTLMRHEDEEMGGALITQPTHWCMVPGTSDCMIASGFAGHFSMCKLKWKNIKGTYSPQDVVQPILPGSTSAMVMDAHHIYTAQEHSIVRFPCGSRGVPGEVIYKTESEQTQVVSNLVWCGPGRHLFVATLTHSEGEEYVRFDLVVLRRQDPSASSSFVPYTLVTDIPHYDFGKDDVSLDFDLLISAGSGPSHVLVRSETHFRLFPLPFPLV